MKITKILNKIDMKGLFVILLTILMSSAGMVNARVLVNEAPWLTPAIDTSIYEDGQIRPPSGSDNFDFVPDAYRVDYSQWSKTHSGPADCNSSCAALDKKCIGSFSSFDQDEPTNEDPYDIFYCSGGEYKKMFGVTWSIEENFSTGFGESIAKAACASKGGNLFKNFSGDNYYWGGIALCRSCGIVAEENKKGQCGTANGKVYPNDRTSYSPDTQCSIGDSSNTLFPEQGSTASWVCYGLKGGESSGICSASKEKDPTEEEEGEPSGPGPGGRGGGGTQPGSGGGDPVLPPHATSTSGCSGNLDVEPSEYHSCTDGELNLDIGWSVLGKNVGCTAKSYPDVDWNGAKNASGHENYIVDLIKKFPNAPIGDLSFELECTSEENTPITFTDYILDDNPGACYQMGLSLTDSSGAAINTSNFVGDSAVLNWAVSLPGAPECNAICLPDVGCILSEEDPDGNIKDIETSYSNNDINSDDCYTSEGGTSTVSFGKQGEYTYFMNCSADRCDNRLEYISVNVKLPPPTVDIISADPSVVGQGKNSSLLKWDIKKATSCTLKGVANGRTKDETTGGFRILKDETVINQDISPTSVNGNITFPEMIATVDMTLECQNNVGEKAKDTTKIEVRNLVPIILDFKAVPNSIFVGQSSKLEWVAKYADVCTSCTGNWSNSNYCGVTISGANVAGNKDLGVFDQPGINTYGLRCMINGGMTNATAETSLEVKASTTIDKNCSYQLDTDVINPTDEQCMAESNWGLPRYYGEKLVDQDGNMVNASECKTIGNPLTLSQRYAGDCPSGGL